MATKKKVTLLTTEEEIMTAYMEYYISTPSDSISHKDFIANKRIDSDAFMAQFKDTNVIEERIWSYMMQSSIITVENDLSTEMQGIDNKLFSLFFTFFQNLTFNDTFFKKQLKERKSILQKNRLYSGMKTFFQTYLKNLHQSISCNSVKMGGEAVESILSFGFINAYWTELILLIEFWNTDDSNGYEKTDIAIEKTLKATQEIRSIEPLKSVIDLGKFIWKEKFNKA
jgi:hypothetical protein